MTQLTLADALEGDRLKRQGIARVSAADPEWAAAVDRLVEELADSRAEFTVDDLRALASQRRIGEPAHHNSWGAAFNRARVFGLIRQVGVRKVKHKAGHSRLAGVWVGLRHPSVGLRHEHDCEVEGCVSVNPGLRAV